MNKTIDAIILARDKGGSKKSSGENKTFLEIVGKPLLACAVAALSGVAQIRQF